MKTGILAFAFVLAFLMPARAIEIDFSQKLIDLDGKPYQDCKDWDRSNPSDIKCKEWLEHTLGLIAYTALDRPPENPQSIGSVLDQARNGALARKVYKAEKVDLDSKQIDLIVEKIGKLGLRPAEVLRAVEMLDPPRLKEGK